MSFGHSGLSYYIYWLSCYGTSCTQIKNDKHVLSHTVSVGQEFRTAKLSGGPGVS